MDKVISLTKWWQGRRWFRMGWCTLCGRWSWAWILKSENAHEQCWLETK